MKNLQSFGVQELDAIEIRETEGGLFGFDDFVVGAALLVVGAIINDWDDFKKGISGGY